ncbi:hypothetical protein ACJVDH_02220 [Pedobacter sp. AW1-32]|uniref:DUF7935 family protein n=1 Tax=Pedobacter sp. AW1-32 TaxID=3383026 RepID=UPI003FEFF406
MNIQQVITEVVILFLGLFAALIAIYFVINKDLQHFFSLRKLEFLNQNKKELLPLRLQAHERLILFIDRLNPANLLLRLHQQGIKLSVLQAAVIQEIRTEYQHNITQQLYVGSETWAVVRKLKEDTIAMVNNAAQSLPAEANGVDLSKLILQHMASINDNPYDLTMELVKKDIQALF